MSIGTAAVSVRTKPARKPDEEVHCCLANNAVRVTVPLCPRCNKGIWPGTRAKLCRSYNKFQLYHYDCEVL